MSIPIADQFASIAFAQNHDASANVHSHTLDRREMDVGVGAEHHLRAEPEFALREPILNCCPDRPARILLFSQPKSSPWSLPSSHSKGAFRDVTATILRFFKAQVELGPARLGSAGYRAPAERRPAGPSPAGGTPPRPAERRPVSRRVRAGSPGRPSSRARRR